MLHHIVLPCDIKEAAKRNRIQIAEEKRKQVIFDTKSRIIGIDVAALELQKQEKQDKILEEKSYDDYYYRLQKQEELKVRELEEKQAREIALKNLELENYRKEFQKKGPKSSNGFTGNALDVGNQYNSEEDQRYLLTSAQRFDSEKDCPEERLREQKKQQKGWLQQQIMEKKLREQEIKKCNFIVSESNAVKDKQVFKLLETEKQCRTDIAKAVEEFNQLMAVEKSNENKLKLKAEQSDNLMEIVGTLTSDFLTEQVLSVPSSLNLNKFVTTTYKGMTPEQIKEIKEFQMKQIEDHKERQRLEQLEVKKWNDLMKEALNKQAESDKALNQGKRNLMQQLRWENEKLAHDQLEKQRYHDRNVHKVVSATNDFYSKFNTSSR